MPHHESGQGASRRPKGVDGLAEERLRPLDELTALVGRGTLHDPAADLRAEERLELGVDLGVDLGRPVDDLSLDGLMTESAT